MEAVYDREQDLARLLAGEAPRDRALVCRLSAGFSFLTDFLREKYLREYIREGGSKIKFVTGRPGSGKTHLLYQMSALAEEEDYVTVHFSAREVWLHDFREIYAEIFGQCRFLDCLKRCSEQIIRQMGYDPAEIAEGMTFMDYLSQNGMGDALTRREIRLQLREMFLNNPLLDNNFALACSMLTGSILGYPLQCPPYAALPGRGHTHGWQIGPLCHGGQSGNPAWPLQSGADPLHEAQAGGYLRKHPPAHRRH